MLEKHSKGHLVRIRAGRLGGNRYALQGRYIVPLRDETQARARAERLKAMAEKIAAANQAERGRKLLESTETAIEDAAFEQIERLADLLCKGKLPETNPNGPTFGDVAKEWTSGALAVRFPDHVRRKSEKGRDLDAARLTKLCAASVGHGRALGDVPLAQFTVDHAEAAMQAIPTEKRAAKRPATRRAYAQTIHRVLSLAVYPCRYIPANPLPRGFLPKIGKPPTYTFLRPAEDRALLACAEVPLLRRALFGFLAREGLRLGEALALRWRDLDLEAGTIALHETKTDDARTWALDPAVARALAAWREHSPGVLVFPGVEDDGGLAETLRTDLLLAGVDRDEIHTNAGSRRQFRVHDLRGTFVTLSLANGRSETWVADRTGHTSSQMINRYRRQARTAAELNLGSLEDLDLAIPELSPIPGIVAGLALASGIRWPDPWPNALSLGSDDAPKSRKSLGGPTGDRTRDLRIKNPQL